jgi:hypothetical protein
MTYKGFNPVAFARTSSTTLAKHITQLEDAFMRNFQMGALLEAAGRVNFNNGGEGFDWPVQYRIQNVEGNTGETQRNFARRNLFKVANQEYRGYQVTDSMYYREFRANRGPEGIVKVYDQFVERLDTSLRQALGTEFYVDGSATGNEQSWHGLNSMFLPATAMETLDSDAGSIGTFTERAANVLDIAGYPDGNYAGIDVELGAFGGEQDSTAHWPNSVADPEADFWTPLVVNYTTSHADLPSGTNTWAGQGDEALRWGIIHGQRNTNVDGPMTNIFLSRDLYMGLLNLLDDKEEVQVTSEYSLRSFGFKNVLNFDGIEVSWETAVPVATGFGINYNCIELKSMDDTLLRPEGPEYDIHSQAFNAVVSTLSNLKFKSPRNFVKWMSVAA